MARKSLLSTNIDDLKRRKEEARQAQRAKERERIKARNAKLKADLKQYGKREERQALAALKEFGAMDQPVQVRIGALLFLKEKMSDPKMVEDFAKRGDAFFRNSAADPKDEGGSDAGSGSDAGETREAAWAA